MIKSMTGYGRREGTWSGVSVVVEMRSVNHRFCEVVTRFPKALGFLEDEVKRSVQRRCQRGRIEVIVSLTGGHDGIRVPRADRTLAQAYYRLLRDLQRELRLPGAIDVSLLSSFRDIVTLTDQPADLSRAKQVITRLVNGALADLQAMRRREGQELARDITRRLVMLREAREAIGARVPAVVQGHFDRMKARVEQLVGGQVDPARLTQELALFADRCDVSEELTRLACHLSQFQTVQKDGESVGRKLDFLLQEMGREVNTIGSKANDAAIAALVVGMKAELEKIREQVQNIE
jgi:uncharacterized protein (TIGR00255 family)